jgi:Na+-translocating ferredoxin:NAD+ oxidoreductase RnfG subunit
MKRKALFLALFFLPAAGLLSQVSLSGYTRIQLREACTGRNILSRVLRDGDETQLRWKNSLYGLQVTEVFQARRGRLVLTAVTFADPQGTVPTVVRPSDVDDLYHTGGPFTATGLNLPFDRIVYRVGEIGEPRMSVRDRAVDFKGEVGFGGSIVLTTAAAKTFEIWLESGDP